MKVILRKDVGGVGQRGSVKEVSDGYALNYLIPNGLAEQATPERIIAHERKQNELAAEQAAREVAWAKIAQRLKGSTLALEARANAQGHLYNQISGQHVIAQIKKVFGIDVPPEAVIMNAPIKAVGEYEIGVRLGTSNTKMTLAVKSA